MMGAVRGWSIIAWLVGTGVSALVAWSGVHLAISGVVREQSAPIAIPSAPSTPSPPASRGTSTSRPSGEQPALDVVQRFTRGGQVLLTRSEDDVVQVNARPNPGYTVRYARDDDQTMITFTGPGHVSSVQATWGDGRPLEVTVSEADIS